MTTENSYPVKCANILEGTSLLEKYHLFWEYIKLVNTVTENIGIYEKKDILNGISVNNEKLGYFFKIISNLKAFFNWFLKYICIEYIIKYSVCKKLD